MKYTRRAFFPSQWLLSLCLKYTIFLGRKQQNSLNWLCCQLSLTTNIEEISKWDSTYFESFFPLYSATLYPSRLCLHLILLMFAGTSPFETLFLGIYNTLHYFVVLLLSLRTISFSLLYFLLIPLCSIFSLYPLLWRVNTYSYASTVSPAQIILCPNSSLASVSSFCRIIYCVMQWHIKGFN